MQFSWRRVGRVLAAFFAVAVVMLIGRVVYCRSMPALPNGYSLGRDWVGEEMVIRAAPGSGLVSRLGWSGIAVDGIIVAVTVEAERFIIAEQRLGWGQPRSYYFVIDSSEHTVVGPLSEARLKVEVGRLLEALRFRRVPCQ